jgi:hypothetical protein
MKKKEDINDYCTAKDAAAILSQKHGRPIRPDYIGKMRRSKRHAIRSVLVGDRWMYHREDIAACTVTHKRSA